jgi:tripartite ATP-independent transporter DctP family solute receptor
MQLIGSRLRIFFPASALFAILWVAQSCHTTSQEFELKLGHALDRTHPVHQGMVYMAQLVEERSRGKTRIQIYPSEQLGDERELLELLQVGAVAIAKVGGLVLENFHPAVGVFNLPYLFQDEESFWRVLDGNIGQGLLQELESYGFKGLCYYDSGSRSFYTRDRPIRTPEDLKGMKVRVPNSATAIEMVRQLGGSATPIAFGELYSALQQGIVDGAENNPPSFYTSRHFEVCRYYVLDQHTRVPDFLLMSLEVWRRLPPDVQLLIRQAAEDSVPYQRQLWDEAVTQIMHDLKKAGVEVIYPDRQPFARSVEQMLQSYEKKSEFGNLLVTIREFQRDH